MILMIIFTLFTAQNPENYGLWLIISFSWGVISRHSLAGANNHGTTPYPFAFTADQILDIQGSRVPTPGTRCSTSPSKQDIIIFCGLHI